MTEAPRSLETRKIDTLKRLAEDVDAWVSTGAPDGTPYLMPLSFLWNGETILLSTARKNPTGQNLLASKQLHLGLGHTRDVVLVIGTATTVTPTRGTIDAFALKTGFDPSRLADYPYFEVTPIRIQAWREVNELKGRDLMRDGRWLI